MYISWLSQSSAYTLPAPPGSSLRRPGAAFPGTPNAQTFFSSVSL